MKIIIRFLPFILIVILINGSIKFGRTQNLLDAFKSEVDTNYIRTFPNALTLKLFNNNKILRMNLEEWNNNYALQYLPNGNSTIGIGVSYKWIGFGLSMKIIDRENTGKYGETNYFDFQTNILLRKGFFDVFIQAYEGFYLGNTAAMIKDWDDPDTYMIRPDINVFSSGINYTHLFNAKKFSYISSFSQTEVQKKSAGSVILGASINYHSIKADSSLVPSNIIYEDAFTGSNLTTLKGITTNARFGYAHTLVAVERFFVSLSLDVGLSYAYSGYQTEVGAKQKHVFHVYPNGSVKLATGYNHNKWFVGITLANYYQLNKASELDNAIRIEYGYIKFVIARRIILKKEIFLPKL